MMKGGVIGCIHSNLARLIPDYMVLLVSACPHRLRLLADYNATNGT
jgi:hypothetical protein